MASQSTLRESAKNLEENNLKEKDEEQKEDKDIAVAAFDGDTIIVCDEACVNLACQDSTWVVDTVASFHITARRDFFSSYTSDSFGWVRIGNETKM